MHELAIMIDSGAIIIANLNYMAVKMGSDKLKIARTRARMKIGIRNLVS